MSLFIWMISNGHLEKKRFFPREQKHSRLFLYFPKELAVVSHRTLKQVWRFFASLDLKTWQIRGYYIHHFLLVLGLSSGICQ